MPPFTRRATMVEINVVGDREFGREIFGMGVRAMKLQGAFVEILEILRESVRQQHRSQGARGGTPYKPLSDAYAAWKRRVYPSARYILILTGALYDSLAHKTKDSIAVATDDTLTFGSTASNKKGKPILGYHQSRRPRKKLPRRPLFEPNDDDKDEIVEVFRDHIIALRRAGLQAARRAV